MTDVKKAKEFLKSQNISPAVVQPASLVKISNQLGKSFSETLDLIAFLKTAGSGYGPFPFFSKLTTGSYR